MRKSKTVVNQVVGNEVVENNTVVAFDSKTVLKGLRTQANKYLDFTTNQFKALDKQSLETLQKNLAMLLSLETNKTKKEDYTMLYDIVMDTINPLTITDIPLEKVANTKPPKAPKKSTSKVDKKAPAKDVKKTKEETKTVQVNETTPQEEKTLKEEPKEDILTQDTTNKEEAKKGTEKVTRKTIKNGDRISLLNEEYESNYIVVSANRYNVVVRCTDIGNEANVIMLLPEHMKSRTIEFELEGILNIVLA